MSKHTPGPWIFENRDGDHPLNDQNGWGCDGLWAVNGGFILGAGPGWDGAYQAPTEANARLIAAAPEMLELIQNVARTWEDDCQFIPCDTEAASALSNKLARLAAQAAPLLAKIEGGGNE